MRPNPYAAPQAIQRLPTDLVERQHRDEVVGILRRFLNEELTAFEFDEALDSFRDSSDAAVRFVVEAVWFHYDDCDDHLVALGKSQWDYFQRLLLLLDSKRRVETITSRRWSCWQLVALVAVLYFVWKASELGPDQQLLVTALPLGIISIGISYLSRRRNEPGTQRQSVYPFASIADIRAAYQSVTFQKSRYRRPIQSREIRSPIVERLLYLRFYMMWLAFSPIVLVFQMLPRVETETRVFIPSDGTAQDSVC